MGTFIHLQLYTLSYRKDSAQWVPEPDPLPSISFDTRPDPMQL